MKDLLNVLNSIAEAPLRFLNFTWLESFTFLLLNFFNKKTCKNAK